MNATTQPNKAYITKTRLGVLLVSSMGMASLAITPSYSAIAQNFHLSNTAVQMLTSLPNLFMMIAGLVMGKMSAGKINLKTLTTIMIILICLGGFAPLFYHTSFAFLLVCSCLVGFGQGACTNLGQVLIAKILPAKERQSTMGLTTTFTNIGGIVFIQGGGMLAASSTWVANYWIYVFSALVLICVLALLPLNPLPVDGGEDAAKKATEAKGSIKLNKYVFYCAGWAFCTMLLNNVLNNNISLFIASQKLGSTSQAALTSTISLIGGMLCGFVVGAIGKKFKYSSIALSFLLYGLSYLVVGYATNLAMAFVGSFVVGAAMSVAMGQFAYLISVAVDKNSTSMALGVYGAINPIGGVVSPFVINGLTAATGLNAFVIGGILALVLAVICLAGQFQKHLVQFASEK